MPLQSGIWSSAISTSKGTPASSASRKSFIVSAPVAAVTTSKPEGCNWPVSTRRFVGLSSITSTRLPFGLTREASGCAAS